MVGIGFGCVSGGFFSCHDIYIIVQCFPLGFAKLKRAYVYASSFTTDLVAIGRVIRSCSLN